MSAPSLASDPVLPRLREALSSLYGERLARVVLFGSRASGQATPSSDYDVAVFLTTVADRWMEMDRLADLRVCMFDETGAFVDAMLYPASSYDDSSPLMHEIRRVGRDL